MNARLIFGNFIHSRDRNALAFYPQHYLLVEDGLCKGLFPTLPEALRPLPVDDFGDRLIIPGMTDLHLHAPQFSFRGLGMDMELMDWLDRCTFPEEMRYRDLDYAARAYGSFVRHLRVSPTTRASVFATVHVPATELLMRLLEDSGLVTFVGKVNMDRNCPDGLREQSPEAAVAETERWIVETQSRFPHTKPILTPRFVPSCSDALLRGLKTLQERYRLPVQSHLSENVGEIQTVRRLCPESEFYGEAYDRVGLFGGDHACIMAHCVHSVDEELELIRQNGVFIAHSPESNMNLASGIAPATRYLEMGLNVGLATDVAGGSHESMFRAVMHAIQASKLRWRLLDETVPPLSLDQAFYLATAGGGAFFGRVGRFEPGFEFDAVVVDDESLDHPQELSLRNRLERAMYLADDRNIYAKFVAGARLF